MLTREENELLCRTGPNDPAGVLLRRYWQPVALAEEIEPGSAPMPVRILSEDLTLFRTSNGRLGLVARHCATVRGPELRAHRRAGCAVSTTAGCTTSTATAWSSRASLRAARSRTRSNCSRTR